MEYHEITTKVVKVVNTNAGRYRTPEGGEMEMTEVEKSELY